MNRIEASPDCDTIIFAIYRPDKEPVEDPASRVTFDKRTIDKCLLSGQTYEYCDIGFHIESTWAKIMRADVIREHCVRMPEHLFLDEDAVYCLHLFQHCRKVAFDSHHIYHYEIRYDSFCHKYSDVAVKMLPLILQEQERYLEKYHPNDAEYSTANDLAVFSWFNEAEEHIAAARRFYNAAVTELKNAVEIFPSSLVAKIIGVKADMPFFKADEIEKARIDVKDFFK